jgi:RecJ-like exonuclease
MKLSITIYSNRMEHAVAFPAEWVICPDCEGCATDRGRNVECDGGGFTAEEWDEQDEDFRRDYMAGRYDQPCEFCKGLGRIQIIDRDAVTDWRGKIFLRAIDAQERDRIEIDAIHAAERRAGA